MARIFSDSKNLKNIIESYGWSMYNTTISPARTEPVTWDDLNCLDPVQNYEVGCRYTFLPDPEKNQSLSEAYAESRRNYIIPIFRIPQGERKFNLRAVGKFPFAGFDFYFLSQIQFKEEEVIAFADPFIYPPYSSVINIPKCNAFDAFACYFGTIKFENNGYPTLLQKKVTLN